MTTPPAEPRVDPYDMVLPYAQRLLACLCAELAKSLAGPVCQCCVRPGLFPPMDACCGSCDGGPRGQASVTVTSVYPSTNFPTRGVDTRLTNCRGHGWAAELLLTVYRCVGVPDANGNGPSCEQLEWDAAQLLSDAAAMRRAIACCDWHDDDDNPGDNRDIVPDQWVPVPPRGGCAGGRMTVILDLGGECCPEDS